jgi:hypothetical protein
VNKVLSTPDKIKQYHSKKTAQIKQSQAKSEQGFDPRPGVTPDKINRNQATQSSKNNENQATSKQGFYPSPHIKSRLTSAIK